MRISIHKLEELKKELAAIPPKSDRDQQVSLLPAIRKIAPELEGLRKKGHQIADIVKLLGERQITIKPNTLRAYLERIRAAGPVARRRKKVAALKAIATAHVANNDPPPTAGTMASHTDALPGSLAGTAEVAPAPNSAWDSADETVKVDMSDASSPSDDAVIRTPKMQQKA